MYKISIVKSTDIGVTEDYTKRPLAPDLVFLPRKTILPMYLEFQNLVVP